MLWTIAVILVVLWALGLVSGYTMGSFIHILLVLAIILVLVRLIQGRRIVSASPAPPDDPGIRHAQSSSIFETCDVRWEGHMSYANDKALWMLKTHQEP